MEAVEPSSFKSIFELEIYEKARGGHFKKLAFNFKYCNDKGLLNLEK